MIAILTQPIQVDAKVQVNEAPIRSVFESMGYKVSAQGNYIKLTREQDDVILLAANSKKAIKNGREFPLTKPIRYDKQQGRAMIHVLDIYKLAKEDKKEKHYRVQKGDTLFSIGQKNGVTIEELKRWNGLTSDTVVPDQHLHIKDPTYVVQPGDSIWEIAHKTESSVDDIKAVNDLLTDFLVPGQKLMIPVQPSMTPPAIFADGVFPLAQETYEPYDDGYGGTRNFSTDGKVRSHDGIDIMTPKWVPVFAAIEGRVVNFGWNTYGGYRVTIRAKNGTTFYYAHLMGYPPGLAKGQNVARGQLIGYAGDTGYGPLGTKGKFAPHLHFGMYDAKGKAIYPYYYLKWWEMKP